MTSLICFVCLFMCIIQVHNTEDQETMSCFLNVVSTNPLASVPCPPPGTDYMYWEDFLTFARTESNITEDQDLNDIRTVCDLQNRPSTTSTSTTATTATTTPTSSTTTQTEATFTTTVTTPQGTNTTGSTPFPCDIDNSSVVILVFCVIFVLLLVVLCVYLKQIHTHKRCWRKHRVQAESRTGGPAVNPEYPDLHSVDREESNGKSLAFRKNVFEHCSVFYQADQMTVQIITEEYTCNSYYNGIESI